MNKKEESPSNAINVTPPFKKPSSSSDAFFSTPKEEEKMLAIQNALKPFQERYEHRKAAKSARQNKPELQEQEQTSDDSSDDEMIFKMEF